MKVGDFVIITKAFPYLHFNEVGYLGMIVNEVEEEEDCFVVRTTPGDDDGLIYKSDEMRLATKDEIVTAMEKLFDRGYVNPWEKDL